MVLIAKVQARGRIGCRNNLHNADSGHRIRWECHSVVQLTDSMFFQNLKAIVFPTHPLEFGLFKPGRKQDQRKRQGAHRQP